MPPGVKFTPVQELANTLDHVIDAGEPEETVDGLTTIATATLLCVSDEELVEPGVASLWVS